MAKLKKNAGINIKTNLNIYILINKVKYYLLIYRKKDIQYVFIT